MTLIHDYTGLFFNPRKSFEHIKSVNLKNSVFRLIGLASIFFILWVVRTFCLVKSNIISADKYLYKYLFESFSLNVIGAFLFIFLMTILLVFVIALIVSLIVKILLLLIRIRLDYQDLFKISIFTFIPSVLAQLIYLILTLMEVGKYQLFVTYLAYAYGIILFFIGVAVLIKLPAFKFKISLIIVSLILLIILFFIFINADVEHGSLTKSYENKPLIAKIDGETIFTQSDVRDLCYSITCSGVSAESCYKGQDNVWLCGYSFRIKLSEEAATRLRTKIKDMSLVNMSGMSYLSKPLIYYIGDSVLDTVWIDEKMRNESFDYLSVSGLAKGTTEKEATINAMSDMTDLQFVLRERIKSGK
jgi:hypothetical protein